MLYKVFFTPLITFSFSKHSKYNFADVEKSDRRPYGWTTSINSSFPNIKDDDPVVSPEIRDNLMADLKEEMVENFREMKIPDKFKYENKENDDLIPSGISSTSSFDIGLMTEKDWENVIEIIFSYFLNRFYMTNMNKSPIDHRAFSNIWTNTLARLSLR